MMARKRREDNEVKFEWLLTVANNTGFDFRMEFARGTLLFGT